MVKKMTQLRYFGEGNGLTNHTNLWNLNTTTDKYELDFTETLAPITYLGIQALPGSKFYINDNTTEIIIGASGIYQLDLSNSTGSIYKISIAKAVITLINEIYQNKNTITRPAAHLIIDLVYEGSDEDLEEEDDSTPEDSTITLYNTTGYNTDGAMTQRAVTAALDSMAHSYDAETLIIP